MVLTMTLVFAVLAVFSMPIALALGVATALTMWLVSPFPLITIAQRMVTGIDSYVLLAIPLFILTGRLMNDCGITDRLFNFARCIVGGVKGGLAHANIIGSMIFAGMSGSAVADAGGIGQIEIKAMKDQGYKHEYAAALTVASSAVGPIIPPSIPMVIYAAIAEVSAGKLFLAGIIPGILMCSTLMAAVVLLEKMGYEKYPAEAPITRGELWASTKDAFWPLLTPIIIVGGIIGGIFTPTEAAAVAAVYSFIMGFFIYRCLKVRDIPGIMADTLVTTAVVTFIISASSGFSWMLIINHAADQLAAWVTTVTSSPALVLLVLNIIMFVIGCLMEAGVLLILLTPLFVPIAVSMNIDLIHFGLIMVLNLMIGVVTPPVGMCLFVVSSITGIQLEKLMKAVLPFIVPLVATLLLCTYWPEMVMWIPNLVMPAKP